MNTSSALLVPLLFAATVFLSWRDNSSNESAFQIERSVNAGPFVPLAQVASNSTAFADETAVASQPNTYRVRAINAGGVSPWSNTATATPGTGTGTPPDGTPGTLTAQVEGSLVNVSTRGMVTATDTTLIPGIVVAGGPVRVLVRVVGESLGAPPLSVPGVCLDPRFSLMNGATVVASNDNWSGDARVKTDAALVGAFALVSDTSKDAALIVTLEPGSYTVVARGATDGIVLGEVYKLPLQ